MRKQAAVAVLLACFALPARGQNPSMSDDFQHMMQWLTGHVSDGLAFNAGSTFDPPTELKPWRLQPDVSLGVGFMPLNKSNFPAIGVKALADLRPDTLLPDQVQFPNLTAHVRMGLPERWDGSVRLVNMSVPKGYKLTPSTTGEGQSNTIGFAVRRHFLGGDLPLVSVAGNFNHVFGHFNFWNQYRNLELTPGFFVDSDNHGKLEWSVNSFGVNTVVSQPMGIWTPFAGLGYNRMSGSVRGRLESVFQTPLILPVVGEASASPEEHQARLIFGGQMDRSRFSAFLNGEMKLIGSQPYKSFIVSVGVVAPFRLGWSATARREKPRSTALADADLGGEESGRAAYAPRVRRAADADASEDAAAGMRDAPSDDYGRAKPAARPAAPASRSLGDVEPMRPRRDLPRDVEPWEESTRTELTGQGWSLFKRKPAEPEPEAEAEDEEPRVRTRARASGAGEPGPTKKLKDKVLRWWRTWEGDPFADDEADGGLSSRPIRTGPALSRELPEAALIH